MKMRNRSYLTDSLMVILGLIFFVVAIVISNVEEFSGTLKAASVLSLYAPIPLIGFGAAGLIVNTTTPKVLVAETIEDEV